MSALRLIEILVTGLASGVLAGLFGIGGGLVTTPAIRLVLGYPALVAVGTPLAVIVPTALTGAWRYWRMGDADVRLALQLGAAGAIGAVGGAYATRFVAGPVILILTSVLLLDSAYRIAWARPTAAPRTAVHPRIVIGIGLGAGLFSGFFGLGGGAIIVPAIVRLLGRSMREAVGTSLLTISLISLPGIAVHAALGHMDWALAGLLVLGVLPGAVIGSRVAYLAEERSLRIGFAFFLVATAAALALSELARLR
jgi:uncharacterized protein